MGDLLKDKVAVVTGGAQGLGKADALALASEGADVAICDLNLEGAQAVAEEIKTLGRKSVALKLDVSDYDQVQEVFAQVNDLVAAAFKHHSSCFIRASFGCN